MAWTTGFWTAGLQGTVDRMNLCLLGYGPVADRPAAAAANANSLAYTTDEEKLYYSNGSSWVYMENLTALAQTITGIKTFASIPLLPASDPTTDNQAVRKSYVDAKFTVAETEVFDGNTATSWTDLDLSGTVGAQATLVLLKIIRAAAGAVAFRKNGDTDEFYHTTSDEDAAGVALIHTESVGIHWVVWVATDDSGVVEWRVEGTQNAVVDVIAYIK